MVKLDIILGFEPRVPGSNPGEGTKIFLKIFYEKNLFSNRIFLFVFNLSHMCFSLIYSDNF